MTFFILGSHPTLSLAEIGAVFGFSPHFSNASKEVLVLSDRENISLDIWQDRLAGVTKIGEIIGEVPHGNTTEIAELIFQTIQKRYETLSSEEITKNKCSFGLSIYDNGNPGLTKTLKKELLRIGLETKKRLKTLERPVRFVSSKEPALSSVAITTNGLLESGGEFVLLASKQGLLIGRTAAVQNFAAWSERDYGRPARDAKSGMLPPKLARMMINLSQANPESSTILDPFCGSGTILMEAALMGFQSICGNDVSVKAVEDTQTNMDWLQQQVDFPLPPIHLSTGSAERFAASVQTSFDAIVTEPYLGPPFSGRETITQVQRLVDELTFLYQTSFQSLCERLKPGGRLVVAFPYFRLAQEDISVPIPRIFASLPVKLCSPIPLSVPGILKQMTPDGGLLYARPDQHVARAIFVFEKT